MGSVPTFLALVICSGGLAVLDNQTESKKPTGCQVGSEMPSFYVREITGSHPNLAVCLVCKNGERPVVMISVRKLDQQVERLIEALDRIVDSHRAQWLRGFD